MDASAALTSCTAQMQLVLVSGNAWQLMLSSWELTLSALQELSKHEGPDCALHVEPHCLNITRQRVLYPPELLTKY